MDLRLDLVPIEEAKRLAPLGGFVDPGAELLDLVGLVGDGQVARLLEVALDPMLASECDEPREVREAFALEEIELVPEVEDPVGQAVGQRRLAEAAVPAAG